MEIPEFDDEKPVPAAAPSHHKLLIPLGYLAFVVLPIIGVILFFVWFSNKPAPVRAEKEPSAEELTTPSQKTQTAHEMKKKPIISPSEVKRKESSGVSTTGSAEPRKDSESNSSIGVIVLPKTDSSVTKTDLSPLDVTIAPAPRMIEYGTLRLTTTTPVSREVTAWVEVDAKRVATWEAKQTKLDTKLLVGHHTVKIFSIYKNTKLTIFEAEVEITPDKVSEVAVQQKK